MQLNWRCEVLIWTLLLLVKNWLLHQPQRDFPDISDLMQKKGLVFVKFTERVWNAWHEQYREYSLLLLLRYWVYCMQKHLFILVSLQWSELAAPIDHNQIE